MLDVFFVLLKCRPKYILEEIYEKGKFFSDYFPNEKVIADMVLLYKRR